MRTAIVLASLISFSPLLTSAQELESLGGVRLVLDRGSARSLATGSTGIAARRGDLAAINPAAIAGAARSFSADWGRHTIEGRYIGDGDLRTVGVESTTSRIRSASLTLPLAGLTWSLFYDQPLDVSHSTVPAFAGATSAPFFVCEGRLSATSCDAPSVLYNVPVTWPLDISLDLQRYGAAAAWSRGPVSVGASLRQERLRQESVFSPSILSTYAGTAETSDDTSLTWGAGLTWELSSALRVGATYSSGGSFAGSRTFSANTAQTIEFRTPPSAGVGVSFEPLPQLTLMADVVRVQYSEMMHEERNVFPQGSELGYADVDELHAGAEYRAGKLALRAGWWRDPAHGLAIRNGVTPPPPFDYAPAILDSDQDHLTAGIGYGEKTRLDASIDRSARSTQVAVGIATTF